MTIASTTNRISYNGTGALTPLAIAFPFQAFADLVVVETIITTGVQTTLVLNTDYTIGGTPDTLGHYPNGGTVTPVSTFLTTVRWTIYRDPSRIQGLDLVENDSLPAESVEAAFDYQTMLIQRTSDLIARSLRQPDGDSTDIATLPSAVDRASAYLGFNTNGDPIPLAVPAGTTTVSAFMATVLDDANASTARTTLGSVGLTGNETIAGDKAFTGLMDLSGAAAGQVKFPATQNASSNANTLDDYAEGTWTPSVGGNASYTQQVGKYTKIGRQVTLTCNLIINVLGTGSVNTISGNPFTLPADTIGGIGAVFWSTAGDTFVAMVVKASASSASLALYTTKVAANGLSLQTAMGNASNIQFSITFMV